MERLLLSLLETSAAVGVIVLALAALSPLLNKVLVARWKYWIWLLLAVRLLIPWNPDLPALPFFLMRRSPDARSISSYMTIRFSMGTL